MMAEIFGSPFSMSASTSKEVYHCTVYNMFAGMHRRIFLFVMDNCIKNVKNADPVVETQKLLKGEYGFMCQYDDEPDFETVWSSIFDLSNLMIYRAEGDPRRKKFITDIRLHNIVLGRKDAEK